MGDVECITYFGSFYMRTESENAKKSKIILKGEKVMHKKYKVRLFGMIMCAVLMITSITAFAGSSSGSFGTSEGRATAYINCTNGKAGARTVPEWSGLSVTTRVTSLSHMGNDVSNYTSTSNWVYAQVSDACMGAESRHTVGTSTYYLSCNNSV